ncbi:hypothetical protein J2Y45_006849 [Dyadobacter sp. BE34]|uniref:Secretion system C-terminal sorting domain-containing protein n=1 Tax=Dyadobacter fermentans TaxID=94254 RepID=A0ABU1RB10_9BACT|nr:MULTISPECIES: T9SS type A sorting domain-containing protein [Dyadobacter]OJV17332.1 MAG: hypothetical protein BGO21_25950 [Dyadobacter sp. 50-39]MDR6809770.1 hypothetical protein [Dyadobacter fermentans]MDR7047515.1 hypothetical protein [Dyadobacter sp. BE242]MDR7201685.1 hypothetical protein [Dyadobacter sp. BE34]MDR7219555.1 hypothetical protein [Dyadobacter sp. BE31]
MKMGRHCWLLLCVLSLVVHIPGFGQISWFVRDTSTVLLNGSKSASLAWTGGLNAAQYHKMDLDGDQTEDLVVFDRTNGKISTFVAATDNKGLQFWKYAPQFESRFPVLYNWIFLADYDGDGRKDLFASTSLGVQLYRNDLSQGKWNWKLVRDALYTKGYSGFLNLLISGSDIPAIVDLDNDGDLDILGFDYSGTFIELHQNMSMERFGVPDSLGSVANPVFVRNGDCWGDFAKNSAQDYVLGMDCGVSQNPDSSGRVMHSGNSILVDDLNGDGKKDLIVGHISSTELGIFYNGRHGINAGFTSYQKTFPDKNPVSMQIFPAAFVADLDFDGIKDLVVSPNLPSGDAGLTDFAISNWFYHNAASNDSVDFRLVSKAFLQEQMLDIGENAAPSFFDIDGDSDLDLIIGTGPIAGAIGMQGSLWLFENIGTSKAPIYRAILDNYLGINNLIKGYNIRPQWADFDGDGTVDLGLGFSTPRGLGYVFFPNRSTLGAAADLQMSRMVTLSLPADANSGDSPFFVDADHDGDLDLLLGSVQGNLRYYKNDGTPIKPVFRLQTENLAGIALSFEKRYVHALAADVDLDGELDLITVDYSGKVRIYHQGPWGEWKRIDELVLDTGSGAVAPVLGRMLQAAAADYNGDGKIDLAVGSSAGGLQLFANILAVQPRTSDRDALVVYPNPARGYIRVNVNMSGKLKIHNVKGQQVIPTQDVRQNELRHINVPNWPSGLYVVSLETEHEVFSKKIALTN